MVELPGPIKALLDEMLQERINDMALKISGMSAEDAIAYLEADMDRLRARLGEEPPVK